MGVDLTWFDCNTVAFNFQRNSLKSSAILSWTKIIKTIPEIKTVNKHENSLLANRR